MTVAERDKYTFNGKHFETRTEPVSVKFIIGDTIARLVNVPLMEHLLIYKILTIFGGYEDILILPKYTGISLIKHIIS